MNISIEKIKKLRSATKRGLLECKKALLKAEGDLEEAQKILEAEVKEGKIASKPGAKKEGHIASYIHHKGRIGVLLKLTCQTDFVAKNPDFRDLAHELAMQVGAMNPENVEELLDQEYIRDPQKKVRDLILEAQAKFGENIEVADFARLEV